MSEIKTYSDFILNETLKTHDIDLTISNLETNLSLQRYDFEIINNQNNTFKICLFNFNKIQNFYLCLSNLNSLVIDRHGWFPSKINMINISGMTNLISYDEDFIIKNGKYLNTIEIYYEPKFDIELNIPNFLYHLSIQEYERSILSKGLIPKSKSKLSKHLDRIYLCDRIEDCKSLISRMKLHYYNRPIESKINDKWVIYKIDTSDLDIKLYRDPNYENGYYTIDNIPMSKIKISEREK